MIKISKLTDYAMVILTYMGKNAATIFQAQEISLHTNIAYPTVAKLLKQLAKKQLVISQRGINGGYKLAYSPNNISLANVIMALEGPVAITECSSKTKSCAIAATCPIASPWLKINRIIYDALDSYKLSDLITTATCTGT